MARLRALGVGFALALLFVGTTFGEDKCRSGCQGSPQTFKYAEGTTYKYNFESSIDVALSSAEGQQSSTKLKATVLLTQLPQCNQLLRLQNVQVVGPDAKKYSHLADIEKPIRINFHDGHIEDSICVEHGDSQNSLNIKRAVASLFQAALKHHYETDVFGVCPTEIVTRKEGPTVVVQKSRNLNKCSHRESIKQDFFATAFNLDSEIKSSPILTGEYTAEQRIKNGILEHAAVSEHYLYVPFSVGQSGAKATVSTKIHLAGQSKESPPQQVSEPRSIIFESPHLVTSDRSNVDSILAALKDTKSQIEQTVGEHTAKSFVNLIKILRASKKNDILAVYGQVKAGAGFKDKSGAKQVFLDALFRAGTGDTVEVGIELLKNKELNQIEQKIVFLGLAFVKHATLDSLTSAAGLLDQPNLPREAYLGVGTLAGRYCREHPCENQPAVDQLVQKLVSKLGDGKANNRQAENQIISVLKALGNVEFLSDAAVGKVVAIAQDKKGPSRVRVAALETLLTDACKDKVRDSALGVLKDIQQDSEIRIKAYLVAAQCPNGKVANALKNLLDKEPSYQVGGFILSHLRNLKASASPDKQLAKHQLGNVATAKKFPIDLRKYSFNSELSYTIDTLGAASSAEANVIYSQESFLPRSTSLNLTAQLFGHTFNFLELGTRQENLDRLLEHYLGPLGVLSESSADDLVSHGKASLDKIVRHLRERMARTRGKRDVSKGELDHINKDVQIKTNKLNADLDVDLSVKLFGSELLFLSLNDEADSLSPDTIIDKIFDCLDDGIAKAKNFEKTIQSNLLFIDSEFSYPTSMGFPLRLGIEGSSSVQLKTAGKIDVQAILRGDRAPLKISLIPSANIDITGSITVDAQVVEGGLKVASSLYTATGGDLEVVVLENNKGVDIKYSIPVEEQKLVSLNHEIVYISRELGKSAVATPIKFGQNKDFSVCIDQLSPFLGLVFCADINSPPSISKHGPTLPFPLSGNAKFSVGIHREDLSLYHYKSLVHSEPGKFGGEFTIEVLGAKQDKKVEFHVEAFTAPEAYIKANLISPILSASADARVISNNQETSLSLQVQLDQQRYLAKVGVSVSGGGGGTTVYKPLIQYDGPGLQGQKLPLNVEGALVVESKPGYAKYTFDNLRLVSASNNKAFSVQGNLGRDGSALFCDVTVSDGSHSGSLKGKAQYENNAFKLNVEQTNNVNPNLNVNVKYDFTHSPTQVDSNLQVIHGADLSSKVNRLTVSNSLLRKYKSKDDFEVRTDNQLSYPALNLNAKFDYEVKPKTLKYDVELEYGRLKTGSELDVKVSQKVSGDYEVEFELYGLEFKVEFDAKREIQGDKSRIENALVFNGKKFEVTGTVTHHFKPEDCNTGADLVIKVPGVAEAIKLNSGLITKPGDLDCHFKLSSGSNVYVDALLKADKGGNANGNLKINLKDFLVTNGQLRVANGAGNGNIVIDLVRLQRKLKADTSFTAQSPTYNVQITFFLDFERDNSNKLSLDTKNQVKPGLIDSKNVLDFLGKKLEANVRATSEGQLNDGKQGVDAEVVFPNNAYLGFKMDRDVHLVNGIGNGNMFMNLEQRDNKNTPGRKVTVKGTGRNFNINEGYFDVTYNIVGECNGKNTNVDLVVKRQPDGDKSIVDIQAKMHGSAVSQPLEVTLHALYNDQHGTLSESFKYGPDFSLTSNAKYDFSETQIGGEVDITVTSPASGSTKYTASGNVARPKEQEITYNVAVGLQGSNGNVKVESDGSVSPKSGQLRGTLHTPNGNPVGLDLGYNIAEERLNGHASVQYENNKAIKAEVTLFKQEGREYKADAKLTTPTSGFRLEIHTQRSPEGKDLQGEIALTADNKRYVLSTALALSDIAPVLDVKLVFPDGKIDRVLVKVNNLSPKNLNGELKIVFGHTNFELDSNLDAKVESLDDFFVKLTTTCKALEIDNLVVEAQNKGGAKGGKRIQVSVNAGGQNIVSGSTTYKAREEGDKFIIEGSGSLKVKEDTKQANFKFVRQSLSVARNGEDGIQISFDAGLGKKAVDAELKVTNKQFHLLNSYCEEKKQCAHVEVDSKIINASPEEFHHELELAVDLRKLGLSHEFGLKGVTTRKAFVLDHTVDIYFQNKENKYQYSLFVHPTEAGAQLTTPKRVISLEGNFEVPKQANSPVKGEIALYLNKKSQPNKKTALSYTSECHRNSGSEVSGNCKTELRFINPATSKDLSVTYNVNVDEKGQAVNYELVVDILPNPNQKLVVSGSGNVNRIGNSGFAVIGVFEAHSAGLNLNVKAEEQLQIDTSTPEFKYSYTINCDVVGSRHDSAIIVQVNPQQAQFVLKALNKDLVNVNSRIQLSEQRAVADTNINIFGVPPSVSHFEASLGKILYTVARAANPNDKLQVLAHVEPGQEASVSAELIKGSASSNLARITVRLDEAQFLKTDSAVNSENIKQLGGTIKGDVEKFAGEVRRLAEDSVKESQGEAQKVLELLQQNAGSLKPVRDYYQQELQKLREEIVSDKTLKEVGQFLDGVFGAIFKVVNEVLGRVSDLIEAVVQVGQQQFGKVIEIIQKGIVPRVLEICKSVLDVTATVLEAAADVAFAVLGRISTFIEAHQNEINQILGSFSGITQEIGRFLYAIIKEAKVVVDKEWKEIYDGVRNLHVLEDLKATYNEITKGPVFEGTSRVVLNTIRELLSVVKDAVPSEDVKGLLTTIIQYLDKKIEHQQVDDLAALQGIVRTAISIIQKFLGTIPGGKEFQFSDNIPFLSGDFLRNLPRLAGSQFSPLSYLGNGDLPSAAEILYAISLHPKDYIPPYKLDAVVVQGQHIFTFDGKHITFPGNCNYLLAHDAVNGNFTLVGTFTNGLLTAITLADKHDSITLKKGGLVLLNNAAQEFPVRKQHLEAFRRYESMHLFSKAGIEVICGPDLLVCGVHVSGFYHGQLRGLLGNGNFEPYDDYTLPNGKIVTSESEFGNAYKAKSSCPPVSVVDHSAHHHNPACNKLFGADSPLRICYKSVNPENYKMACAHGLAAGVQDTERAVAIGYTASCRAKRIPVSIPPEYAKCENGDKPYAVGDSFSVKTPGKAADIIVIVDQIKSNEAVYKELVQPLIQQITSDLSAKGVNDIEFHLLGYGGEYQAYPSHYTVAGKLTFKGRSPNLKFSEPPQDAPVSTGCEQIDSAIAILKAIFGEAQLITGRTLQQRTYTEALDYPFRAHAVKSIVAVTGKPCETGFLFGLQKVRALFFANDQISLNLVTPFENFNLQDAKHTKNVIGFNAHNVFSISDAKKKPEGSPELHGDLSYDDYCVDFTLKNHGNVFVTNNFIQAKGPQRKQFTQVAAYNIVEQLLNVEQGLDCECQLVTPYTAQNVCKVSYSKERVVPAKKGGHKG